MNIKSIMGVAQNKLSTRLKGSKTAKLSLGFMALFCLLFPVSVHGLTTITQGYSTTDSVSIGSIVSLKSNTTDQVEAATTSNNNGLIGVVINSANSLLSISSEQSQQIQVATSGVVQVLVSNINGNIYQGDPITSSPISGVGMKATSNSKVVGIAQDNLSTTSSTNQTYTDKSGAKHSVLIGEIPVLVNVSYYYKQPDKTLIPQSIQNIANSLAGKTVNSLPIIISLVIFIVTLMVVTIIVYSMIHSSIISVGRNPMSQSAISRGLIQMSALVVGILAVAVISIYMVLLKF